MTAPTGTTCTTARRRAGPSSCGTCSRRSGTISASSARRLRARPSTLTREALGARLFGPEGLALAPPRAESGSTAQVSVDGQSGSFEVQHARLPTHFFGKFPELGGAVFLIEMEPGRSGPVQTGLWLSTWGLSPDALGSVRAGLRSVADRVFGPRAG